jgi:hypothetical protein
VTEDLNAKIKKWRAQATDLRLNAEHFADSNIKELLLEIASGFETLAAHEEVVARSRLQGVG